jgi:hypothetical protein
MRQFVVPQFIDVEDKIFGPITTRQFVILLAAGIILFLVFRFGDLALFITLLVIIGGLALLFAFVRVNGQAFHYFLLNIIQTFRKPGLRVWRKSYTVDELNYYRKLGEVGDITPEPTAPPVRRARIQNLALLVNTGGAYRPDDQF